MTSQNDMFASSEELCSQGTEGACADSSDVSWTPGTSEADSQPPAPRRIDGDQLFLVTFAAIQSLFV
jgi:hypothetical protein